MSKNIIHTIGWVGLGLLGLTTLPPVISGLQAKIESQAQSVLNAKGFSDVVAISDGQSVYLATKNANHADLNAYLSSARLAMSDVTGGLYQGVDNGGLIMGPVTVTRVDLSKTPPQALSAPVVIAEAPPEVLPEVLEAAQTCTDAVAKTVADRKLSFGFGGYTLTPQSEKILDDVYASLAKCQSGLILHIQGHTDSVGTTHTNQMISQARANSTTEALIKRGMKPEAVKAEGFGQTQPIADNANGQGRAQNRRVVFVMKPA